MLFSTWGCHIKFRKAYCIIKILWEDLCLCTSPNYNNKLCQITLPKTFWINMSKTQRMTSFISWNKTAIRWTYVTKPMNIISEFYFQLSPITSSRLDKLKLHSNIYNFEILLNPQINKASSTNSSGPEPVEVTLLLHRRNST